MTDLAKVELITTVWPVSILGWAAASNRRAVANARVAAVECSRWRLERAEVAMAVAELTAGYAAQPVEQATPSVGHDTGVRTSLRA